MSHPVPAFQLTPTFVPVMSAWSQAPNIFPVLVTWNNLLRMSHARDVPTHPNEELNYRHVCDASDVTPPPFSVFDHLERYTTCFDVGRSRRMLIYGNEVQVRDLLGERRCTAVPG